MARMERMARLAQLSAGERAILARVRGERETLVTDYFRRPTRARGDEARRPPVRPSSEPPPRPSAQPARGVDRCEASGDDSEDELTVCLLYTSPSPRD